MRYRDKTTGRDVELQPSTTEFLVVTNPAEAEGMPAIVAKRSFAVRPSTNDDGVFILQTRNQAESTVEINRQLDELRRDRRVRSVAPGLVDPDTGGTRFMLPDRVVTQFRTFDDAQVMALTARLGA